MLCNQPVQVSEGGAPQDAFGYPNAMLAKPVTGWERKKTIPNRYRLSFTVWGYVLIG
jgi:hypothetical protein